MKPNYTNEFVIAFCQYHGLNLGYLYSDEDTGEKISQFMKLYQNTLMTHREKIARLTIEATCRSLEVNLDEFLTPKIKYGDVGLARQLVCYVLERFGYGNGEIAKTLNFSAPRVSASINTFNQRLRDHHIRVAMVVIYTDVFEQVFTNTMKNENSNYVNIPDRYAQAIRPGNRDGIVLIPGGSA